MKNKDFEEYWKQIKNLEKEIYQIINEAINILEV